MRAPSNPSDSAPDSATPARPRTPTRTPLARTPEHRLSPAETPHGQRHGQPRTVGPGDLSGCLPHVVGTVGRAHPEPDPHPKPGAPPPEDQR